MNASLLLGAAYVAQLGLKSGLALVRQARATIPSPAALEQVTVIQPVTSGDELLAAILRENLAQLAGASFVFVVDDSDREAMEVCRSVRAVYPARNVALISVGEPPDGINPKLWKQQAALPLVHTKLLAVVDDDTRMPRATLDQLVEAVEGGACLASGLPSYVPARGGWSRLVAEFVNSAAILTYLPATVCAEPLSINGMGYVLRTDYVRRTKLFSDTGRSITDDLAIARAVRRDGGRIVQGTRPLFISTTVASLTHYRRLMHRWFVCARLLVQGESLFVRGALVVAFGLPPALLAGLVALALAGRPFAAWSLLAALLVRMATLASLNRVFVGAWRHSPVASPAAELLQPVFLAGAFFHPVIWWRRRRIRVRSFNEFDYLRT